MERDVAQVAPADLPDMYVQAAPGKPWAYAGYKVTVYSNNEEMLNDLMWWDTVPKVRLQSQALNPMKVLRRAAWADAELVHAVTRCYCLCLAGALCFHVLTVAQHSGPGFFRHWCWPCTLMRLWLQATRAIKEQACIFAVSNLEK